MKHIHIEADLFHRSLLRKNLTNIFGEFNDEQLNKLEPNFKWCTIQGGEVLFHQNEIGEHLYLLISGRLQAIKILENGDPHKLGEITRGEVVGEMSVFTDEPRSATVVALRDSILIEISKTDFQEIINAYPDVFTTVTKQVISRLKTSQKTKLQEKQPVNICILPMHNDTLNAFQFFNQIKSNLEKYSSIFFINSTIVNETLNIDSDSHDKHNQAITEWLDKLEFEYDYLYYFMDSTITSWSERCLRHADEVLLLADANQPPNLTNLESVFDKYALSKNSLWEIKKTLILIHPPTTDFPRNTDKWLNIRPNVKNHLHFRNGYELHLQRIARILTGNANGLVLAGGGAKGFASAGVFKALEEENIPIDFVGGTSVGGMVAGAFAFEKSAKEITDNLRETAIFNPTKDFNPYFGISLIKGVRMQMVIQSTIEKFCGTRDILMEDLWINLFVVSSNFTKSKEDLHTRGSLTKYLRATSAIPGVFPPIIEGNDLLVDGATFNNFPADIMLKNRVKYVIGVDFAIEKERILNIKEMPSAFSLFLDKFRPKKKRRFRLPGLMSIVLNSTMMYSISRRRITKELLDLHFNPDVTRFGLLDWKSYDKIVEMGYVNAKETLSSLSDLDLKKFKG